jgi:hypothetical protein
MSETQRKFGSDLRMSVTPVAIALVITALILQFFYMRLLDTPWALILPASSFPVGVYRDLARKLPCFSGEMNRSQFATFYLRHRLMVV